MNKDERQCFDKNNNNKAEPSKPKQACQDHLGRFCEGFKARSRIKIERRRRKGTANEPTRIGVKMKSNDTRGSKRRRFCNSSFSFSEIEALKVELLLFCWCVIFHPIWLPLWTQRKSLTYGEKSDLLFGRMQSTCCFVVVVVVVVVVGKQKYLLETVVSVSFFFFFLMTKKKKKKERKKD